MRVTVKVRPGASRTRVGGRYGEADSQVLCVSVTARAVDGRATEAVLVAVADAFGVQARSVALVGGRTSRTKVLDVAVEPPEGAGRLRALLES